MPPPLHHLLLSGRSRDFDPVEPAAAFASEWTQPSNYAFTILLLLGGDVITRALGQLAGGLVTPVAFSFGTYTPSRMKKTSRRPLLTGSCDL